MLKRILHVKKRQKEQEHWKRETVKTKQMLVENRKWHKELRHLEATIKMEPKELQFLIHRSNSLIESKKYWPAISDLSTIVAMRNPKWTGVALARRADVFWRLGKTDKWWADTTAAKQLRCKGPLRNTCLIATKQKFARLRNDLKKFE